MPAATSATTPPCFKGTKVETATEFVYALAIAVNEATSVEVSRTGLATVVGDGPAYFILADHAPENCVAGTPLTYSNYKIWKVNAGGTFNLANRPGEFCAQGARIP
jgi:cyanophycinase-like exopeptidase